MQRSAPVDSWNCGYALARPAASARTPVTRIVSRTSPTLAHRGGRSSTADRVSLDRERDAERDLQRAELGGPQRSDVVGQAALRQAHQAVAQDRRRVLESLVGSDLDLGRQ